MTDSILTTLGAGSGIDTGKLVTDLVGAARSPRQKSIDARETVNTARLTGLATLASAATTLADGARTRLHALADADVPAFVEDLVTALNDLRGQLGDATRVGATGIAGPLSGDAGARALARTLSGFAGATVPDSSLRLTDIGIATARDGTLTLDSAKLAGAIAADPVKVKQLLGVGTVAPTGIGATLQAVKTAMTGTLGALTVSKGIYTRAAAAIRRDRTRLDTDMTTLGDRLTKSYAAMDKQIAAIKASQAYLTQQVAVWTKSA